MPSLISRLGSSSSDSGGGAGEALGLGVACAVGNRGAGAGRDSSSDPRLTWVSLGTSGAFTGSGLGVSSTSECLPFVQGSIARNSSKVKTRGLQHSQPGESHQHLFLPFWFTWRVVLTYLSAPHGIWVGLDGKHTPRSRPRTFCRSPCEHTSSPFLSVQVNNALNEWRERSNARCSRCCDAPDFVPNILEISRHRRGPSAKLDPGC
jgi:hypothetical protein